jgi:hypothetical protein
MNLFSKAKRLVAFTALTLTLTLSSASLPQHVGSLKFEAGSTSAAAARRFRVVWYFSDATHTTRVGIGTFRCNGIATLSGRSTQFSEEVGNEPCCGTEVC